MTKLNDHIERNSKKLEWTDTLVSRYWDFLSKTPEDYFTYRYGANIIEVFLPFLRPNSKVLDYGSGPGHLVRSILDKAASRSVELYAVDTSPESLKALNSMFSGEFGFQAAYHPDALVQSGTVFDAVFLIETIEHCTDTQFTLMMDNIKKLLKLGGLLFITTPNDEDLKKSQIYCPVCEHSFHRWQHIRSWNKQNLKETLHSLSYTILAINETNFAKSQHWIRRLYRRALARVSKNTKSPHLYLVAKN